MKAFFTIRNIAFFLLAVLVLVVGAALFLQGSPKTALYRVTASDAQSVPCTDDIPITPALLKVGWEAKGRQISDSKIQLQVETASGDVVYFCVPQGAVTAVGKEPAAKTSTLDEVINTASASTNQPANATGEVLGSNVRVVSVKSIGASIEGFLLDVLPASNPIAARLRLLIGGELTSYFLVSILISIVIAGKMFKHTAAEQVIRGQTQVTYYMWIVVILVIAVPLILVFATTMDRDWSIAGEQFVQEVQRNVYITSSPPQSWTFIIWAVSGLLTGAMFFLTMKANRYVRFPKGSARVVYLTEEGIDEAAAMNGYLTVMGPVEGGTEDAPPAHNPATIGGSSEAMQLIEGSIATHRATFIPAGTRVDFSALRTLLVIVRTGFMTYGWFYILPVAFLAFVSFIPQNGDTTVPDMSTFVKIVLFMGGVEILLSLYEFYFSLKEVQALPTLLAAGASLLVSLLIPGLTWLWVILFAYVIGAQKHTLERTAASEAFTALCLGAWGFLVLFYPVALWPFSAWIWKFPDLPWIWTALISPLLKGVGISVGF